MKNLDFVTLAQLCRENNQEAIDFLTLHYYDLIGKRYISENPSKKNKEECAWKLCKLAVINYSKTERKRYKYSTYINKVFRYKYKNYNLEDNLKDIKNVKMEYKEEEYIKLISDAKKDEKGYEKLYKKYYFLVEEQLKTNPNIDIKKINSLYNRILKKYINENEQQYITAFIRNYLTRNIKRGVVTYNLESQAPKRPVDTLIQQAKINPEIKEQLIIRYMYIVDNKIKELPIEIQEEARGKSYLKLVELVDNYFKENMDMKLSVYLNNSMKKYYDSSSFKNKSEIKEENLDYYQNMEVNLEEKMLVQEYLEKSGLTEREKDVIIKTMYEGLTYREISKIYNISFNRIGQIYLDAIEKIKYYAINEKTKKCKNKKRVGVVWKIK